MGRHHGRPVLQWSLRYDLGLSFPFSHHCQEPIAVVVEAGLRMDTLKKVVRNLRHIITQAHGGRTAYIHVIAQADDIVEDRSAEIDRTDVLVSGF